MPRFAPEPAERGAQENVEVDAVGLGAPAVALDRNARGMQDVDFDAMGHQGPRDPETVEARFVPRHHAPDLATGLFRLALPPLDRPEHGADAPAARLRIGRRDRPGTLAATRHDLPINSRMSTSVLAWSKAVVDLRSSDAPA